MSVLGYQSWGLIPVDPDPATGECTSSNPPMMSSLALDSGASLYFSLPGNQVALQIRIEITAFSAEATEADSFAFYSGSQPDQFALLSPEGSAKSYEGQYAVFACTLKKVAHLLKIHNRGPRNLVINRVAFEV